MQKTEEIRLSDHFTYGRLIKFVIPSIGMMIFTSIYGVVDGLFVSNFVGKTPFAALNLIMPLIMILGAVGFMMGTGGTALVAKTLGEGNKQKANSLFSLIVYVTIILGVVLATLGIVFVEPLAVLMGADEALLPHCVLYGRIVMAAIPAFMLQNVFQSFLITAEKPKLGLFVTVAAGVTNIILDALLVAVIPCGLAGAAIATAISQCVGGFVPLVFFIGKNSGLLRLTKAEFDGWALLKVCTNGSSELMTNVSMSLVSMLYNFQLMEIAGEDGIAAYGVLMYVNFIFVASFIGYSIGSAPIIGYHYGALNIDELKSLLRKSLVIISLAGVGMTILAELLAYPLSLIFVSYDEALLELTLHGFQLYSLSFLVCGFNIFGSAFFTALNNGLISAAISFLRTLVFQTAMLFLLPVLWGIDGIWLSITAAELLSLIVTVVFTVAKRKKYGYF